MTSQKQSTPEKRISLLATGNEILQGDIEDANGQTFARTLYGKGGLIYQRLQVSDRKNEIIDALKYLLTHSDAIIVTGGLGPTSDDVTRFAIAEAIDKTLYFDEIAWAHVIQRLQKYNVAIHDANRQQAMFPQGSLLLPNLNGTAFGAQISWQNKHIFMLPGPPRECMPIFEQKVIPALAAENFFTQQQHYRWLTLGLIEGETGPRIDEMAKSYPVETGFRWHYPYLEIKISAPAQDNIAELLATIHADLTPYLVSVDGQDAFQLMHKQIKSLKQPIYLIDNLATHPSMHFNSDMIKPLSAESDLPMGFVIKVSAERTSSTEELYSGALLLRCEAYHHHKQFYLHELQIPNRGPEVTEFTRVYLAWQISRVIMELKDV